MITPQYCLLMSQLCREITKGSQNASVFVPCGCYNKGGGLKQDIYSPAALKTRNLRSVSLGWNEGASRAALLLEALGGICPHLFQL